jgi:uncharacterized membrane protein
LYNKNLEGVRLMPFGFSFANPEYLWLLLLLIPLVYVLGRVGGSGAAMNRRGRRLSIALRLMMVSLIVLSVANLQLVSTSDKLSTVFLLDNSDSMGAGGKAQALDYAQKAIKGMKDNQQAGVVVFGQDALVEKLVGKDKALGNIENQPISSYTNLAEAVRLGTALLPSDSQRRLVLVTDGNQNVDEVRNAAKIAAAAGVQIDVVNIARQDGPEVSVGNVQVPSNLRQGEEFTLRVAVDSNYAGSGRLLILQDGQVISDKPVELKQGANLFQEQLVAKSTGFVNYTAKVITGKDTIEQNNEINAYSLVKGGPKILLIEGHPDQKEAANLEAALKQTGIEASTLPPERFPGLSELAQYDSVIMVNVPASSLNAQNLSVLQSYVKDLGKGMVMVGGEESYGLGGYFRTPLEDMLPVELQLPSRLQTPSVAMVMVIDRSGSMADAYNGPGSGVAGIAKIELAKDAAYLAATQLSNTDQVGIVVFDTQAQWQVPIQVMGNPSNLVSPIGRIAPGGGTNVYSGFAPAVEELKKVTAKNKHIIIMTDGQDSENIDYSPLINDAARAGITVSTVGLGEDVNTNLLRNIAQRGNGRYTFVNDPGNLPKIFAKEAHLAARSYIVEESFTPAIADPSPIIKGISGVPELKGYVGTLAKSTATIALVTKRNEPLLAHWQYGLGRVAAWTSDAKGRWATNWLGWQEFPRFWSQVVRWSVAENEAGGLQVQTKMVGNRIYVTADALSLDSQYLNGLEVKAKVVASNLSGNQEEVTLVQTAPGHYEGYFTPKGAGSYIVNVQGAGQAQVSGATGNANQDVNLKQTVGAVAAYSPEYKQLGNNLDLLKEIATLTGGRTLNLNQPELAFTNDLSRTTRQQELWMWLLLLAILLFPLDIAVRRIRLSPAAIVKGFRNSRKLDEANANTGTSNGNGGIVTDSAPVNRLFNAKKRAARSLADPVDTAEAPPPTAPGTATATLERPPVRPNAPPPVEPVYYNPPKQTKGGLGGLFGGKPKEPGKTPAPKTQNQPPHDMNKWVVPHINENPNSGRVPPPVDPKAVRAAQEKRAAANAAPETPSAYSGLIGRIKRQQEQQDAVPPENNASATAQPQQKAPPPVQRPVPPPPPPAPSPLDDNGEETTNRLLRAKQRARDKGEG